MLVPAPAGPGAERCSSGGARSRQGRLRERSSPRLLSAGSPAPPGELANGACAPSFGAA